MFSTIRLALKKARNSILKVREAARQNYKNALKIIETSILIIFTRQQQSCVKHFGYIRDYKHTT